MSYKVSNAPTRIMKPVSFLEETDFFILRKCIKYTGVLSVEICALSTKKKYGTTCK